MNLKDGYVKLIDKMFHRLLPNLRTHSLHYQAQPSAEIRGMVLPVWADPFSTSPVTGVM